MEPRLEREFLTMHRMVEIHCTDRHGPGEGVCAECEAFLAYVHRRLEKCPYGDRKPTCARCPIHCYKPRERELARGIMRHAGPRMALRHPWLSLLHVADKLRRVEHPMVVRRRERG
ncbi:MAG: nitrous oxide-stimulated promoter family protein [Steroidobacteraceae bacterium]